jgi:lysozyme family protein
MNYDFPQAFKIVVGEEGNYVNDPHDPGGETKYGISKRAYPNEDIKNLTLERAMFLYERDYWNPLVAHKLPGKFMFLAFECAVNQGMSHCVHCLDLAKGQPSWFMAERAMSYTKDHGFDEYGRGWFRRLFSDALTLEG